MCTSLAIGFYIRDKEEFDAFRQSMKEMAAMEHSIFSVFDNKPKQLDFEAQSTDAQTKIRSQSQLKEDIDDDGFCIV